MQHTVQTSQLGFGVSFFVGKWPLLEAALQQI
jgi:hypothetical protein